MAAPAVSERIASPAARRTELLLRATYEAEQRHFWFVGLRRFLRLFAQRAAAGRSDVRLLDCGCGTGANLSVLAEFGTAFGFDISASGPSFARRYGQTRLAQASITQIPFPDDAFDIATSLDVICTLEEDDERRALAEMFRVLRPGGTLIVNVAALELLRGRVLQQAGFIVDRVTYTNCSLFLLVLGIRLAQRLFSRSIPDAPGIEMRVPPAVVNVPLTWLLLAESSLLRVMDMPIGSSLLAVAKKPQ
jgi:SAM-dependent methyltransferase